MSSSWGRDRPPSLCAHKLPTSCALSSTTQCCACSDRRPHAPAYAVYVDGVGSVLRAPRWQQYCSTCKDFWERRVAVAHPAVTFSQSRIPDYPDQTDFLERWHGHFRLFPAAWARSLETQHRAALAENLPEPTVAELPRSLAGLSGADEATEQDGDGADEAADVLPALNFENPSAAGAAHTLSLRREVGHRITASTSYGRRARERRMAQQQASQTPPQVQRIAGLRRDLRRMREDIERIMAGLHQLGDDLSEASQVATVGSDMDQQLAWAEAELRDGEEYISASAGGGAASSRATWGGSGPEGSWSAPTRDLTGPVTPTSTRSGSRGEVARAQAACDQALQRYISASEQLQAALERQQELEQEHRNSDQSSSAFDSHDEAERREADYESPISGMFARAWGSYREREQERRRDRLLRDVLVADDRTVDESTVSDESGWERTSRHGQLSEAERAFLLTDRLTEAHLSGRLPSEGRRRRSRYVPYDDVGPPSEIGSRPLPAYDDRSSQGSHYVGVGNADLLAYLRQDVVAPLHGSLSDDRFQETEYGSSQSSSLDGRGLDDDDGRPPPLEDVDMTVSLACKVCYSQLADTAVLPCGHLVMCQWCAEKHVPSSRHDRTRPTRRTSCPLCRKRVRQKIKIYRG